MPNSQDINVLTICAEMLDALDNTDAVRIIQYLNSRYADATTTKKKRGRPSTKKPISLSSVKKRGRGRPKKNQEPESATSPKRGRGRPPKKILEIIPVVKKKGKRGRPRKNANLIIPVAAKKRGRPAKKKRGRPAKTA